MNPHTVKSYEDELLVLDRKVAQMGGLCEMLLGMAFDSIAKRDPGLAQEVIERDAEIDDLQAQVDEQVIQMIARRQPMANDLRQIMAATRVTNDLERIGDLSKNIAKRAIVIADQNYPRQLVSGLRRMVEIAHAQLKQVLDAYSERNAEAAIEVWHSDEQLDALYNSVFREMLTYMMEDPRNIGHCTHLLFAAKNIERIGDHATNMAELVHFMAVGEPLNDERPKGDETSNTIIEVEE
jgi:phosphate transport system protein